MSWARDGTQVFPLRSCLLHSWPPFLWDLTKGITLASLANSPEPKEKLDVGKSWRTPRVSEGQREPRLIKGGSDFQWRNAAVKECAPLQSSPSNIYGESTACLNVAVVTWKLLQMQLEQSRWNWRKFNVKMMEERVYWVFTRRWDSGVTSCQPLVESTWKPGWLMFSRGRKMFPAKGGHLQQIRSVRNSDSLLHSCWIGEHFH